MVKLPTLYSRTSTGAVQEWTIFVEDDHYRTEFGQVDGKKQTTNWTYARPTNEGRANARNEFEQARFEAEALWKKKKESGCFESIKDIDSFVFVEPMLAKKYEDYANDLEYPLFCQPKLDGLRCIVSKHGMFSRNGKEYKSCPHIFEALKPVFEQDPNIVFDGELYNHEFKADFNKITSLVKKTKPSREDIIESKSLIQYHIYDIVTASKKFNERIVDVVFWTQEYCKNNPSIRVVDTMKISNREALNENYEKYINDGYEGQMIRVDVPYETKRSKYLLKRKEFSDREYVILDIIEGEGNKAGMAGAMVFKNELGHSFNSNIKGSREFLIDIWKNRKTHLGKLATVQYFNLTPDKQVPRFPYVIKIREDFDI